MYDIFYLLLAVAVQRNKSHFRGSTDHLISALLAGNINCAKKLINLGVSLKRNYQKRYVWTFIAREGNVELLKIMFNR